MRNYQRYLSTPLAAIIVLILLSFNYALAQVRHGCITVKYSGVLTIGKNAQLTTNSDISNRGSLVAKGAIILNSNGGQLFPGTGNNTSSINVLEIRNTGTGVAINHSLKISGVLKITAGNLALADYDITIQSTAMQTASVSAIGATGSVSYGLGRFVVERFIPVGIGGHNKSWQLLSVPANGQTIRDAWQEGGASTVGFGTQLSSPLGTSAGYDLYSPSPSLKTYSSALNNFDGGPSSTSNLINNQKGFMLFVRGDRTVLSGSGTTPTTLRIKGTLFTPAVPPPVTVINADKYESVGNPYASQIDFTTAVRTGGVDNKFYAWDPTIAGTYGVGAYQTISATNGWVPVPGGGSYSGIHTNIESGQAVMLHATANSGTLAFTEAAKTGGSKMVNKMSTAGNFSSRQFMRTTLLTSSGLVADGTAAAFDTDLSSTIDRDDALKILNRGENLGLNRGNKVISVEGRRADFISDTLFFFTSNLRQDLYQLVFVPENMDHSKQAFLIDNFLHTQVPVSLIDSSLINFNVTADPSSSSTDRLMLVFKPQAVLATSQTTLKATRNSNRSVDISWQTISGTGIKGYVIERSLNGVNFYEIGRSAAIAAASGESAYYLRDLTCVDKENYYRIRIVATDGSISYSEIEKVRAMRTSTEFSVYPNPISTRKLNILPGENIAGRFDISLTNLSGQKVYTSYTRITNGATQISIDLPASIVAGIYQLIIANQEGHRSVISVVIM